MKTSRADVRVAARKALLQLLEPLTAFVIYAGLSASEMSLLLREAAVKTVAKSQLETSRRTNISGIAATTGISRAEISRILKKKTLQDRRLDDHQQSTNRVLARWHGEPKFTNVDGKPATLKLYGRGTSFESLVKLYGRGIPPRAVLDELIRSRAVEVLPGQRIRAKSALAVHFRLNQRAVESFGNRASQLLSTMLSEMTGSKNRGFVATTTLSADSELLPSIRKELTSRSLGFLSGASEAWPIAPSKHASRTVEVTVLYFETQRKNPRNKPSRNRSNFRRRP